MIEGIFVPKTCEEILAIPFSWECTWDTLIGKENIKHEFSVKSTYHVALQLNKQEVPEHSQGGEDGKLWRTVWKLNVLPKVRTFMWQACANILPTCDNLHQRRVDMDRNCEFYHQQPKMRAHLLWECPFAHNVWSLSSGRVQKCRNEVGKFFNSSKGWRRNWQWRSLNNGLLQCGQSGTQGTELILTRYKHNLKRFWMVL